MRPLRKEVIVPASQIAAARWCAVLAATVVLAAGILDALLF
jgi:hypothetical protein